MTVDACFSSLPPELKLEICECLFVPLHMPQDAYRRRNVGRMSYAELGAEDTQWTRCRVEMQGEEPSSDDMLLNIKLHGALWALRQVSRELYVISNQILHRELDIEQLPFSPLKESGSHLGAGTAVPFDPLQVRSVGIHLGRQVSQWNQLMRSIASVIRRCINMHAIAIYDLDVPLVSSRSLIDELIRFMGAGHVSSFGLYSSVIINTTVDRAYWDRIDISDSLDLLKGILRSPNASRNLRRLDIVLENITSDCIPLLQQNLPNLQSLVIRRAIRERTAGLELPFRMSDWAPSTNITQIHLVRCHPAHASKMVDLVRHFPSLEELMWAICGHPNDVIPPSRLPGWSKAKDALPKVRRPLKRLRLEHVFLWELYVLGEIPAQSVTVANVDESRIVRVLSAPVESFIGMEVLKVPTDQTRASAPILALDAQLPTLEQISERRAVRLRRDARILFPCSCCTERYNIEL